MGTAALGSALHVLGIAAAFAFAALRLVALRKRDLEAIRFADNGNGLAALLVYGAGLWRLFGELEKPLAYYTASPFFWAKMGLLALAGALEVYPQVVVLPWHVRAARKQPIEPKPGQLERVTLCAGLQLPCLVGAVVCAALMARGAGMGPAEGGRTDESASGDPSAALYAKHCQACHQPDGRGVGGKVAADLTSGVLDQADEVLLTSIERGKQGPRGLMPAWGHVIGPSERAALLAWLRTRYGAGARGGERASPSTAP